MQSERFRQTFSSERGHDESECFYPRTAIKDNKVFHLDSTSTTTQIVDDVELLVLDEDELKHRHTGDRIAWLDW